ncbi:hypothetical protein [Nocardia terpenica]|uniref:hypothetical protein n=1 Tax=Nocardia terpenica TaxID=455432 RepID=UPI000ABEF1AF|nr:hypothetical protein [Nocardia terpenica]NQE89948.1 hypothetical protein [Nocardia terpenica]
MSAPDDRPCRTPEMQAWIDEQRKHFPPEWIDSVIRDMRMYERINRERAARTEAGEAA